MRRFMLQIELFIGDVDAPRLRKKLTMALLLLFLTTSEPFCIYLKFCFATMARLFPNTALVTCQFY